MLIYFVVSVYLRLTERCHNVKQFQDESKQPVLTRKSNDTQQPATAAQRSVLLQRQYLHRLSHSSVCLCVCVCVHSVISASELPDQKYLRCDKQATKHNKTMKNTCAAAIAGPTVCYQSKVFKTSVKLLWKTMLYAQNVSTLRAKEQAWQQHICVDFRPRQQGGHQKLQNIRWPCGVK